MNDRSPMSHEEATELLPWLVNGSMDEDEGQRVREHALSCIVCRRELAELKTFADLVYEEARTAQIPPPDMRQINARIDDLIEGRNRWRRGMSWIGDMTSRPWRLAFAIQTVLVIVLATVLLWPQPQDAVFTTLTQPPAIGNGHHVRVVFSTDMTISELGQLLDDLSLVVADGPGSNGVYTLSVSETMSEAEISKLIRNLQGNPRVRFAQLATP